MTKYIKYLISLFFIFGLTVNDGALACQSNRPDYFQFSNQVPPNGENFSRSKSYLFKRTATSDKAAFPIFITYLNSKDIFSLQVGVLLKSQTLLFQKISSFTKQYLLSTEIFNSKDSYRTLYIA